MRRTRKSSRRSWPVAYRWLTIGAVVIYTAIGSRTVSVAAAQELPDRTRNDVARNRNTPPRTIEFNIPPGRLESAIGAFERTTGVHVIIPEAGMLTLASPGVSGVYKFDQALEQILVGTGLEYRITGPRTVALELRRVSTLVEVSSDAAALAVSTPKYTESILDTPQTISVVPQSIIEEQNATTLRDTLRNVAGISLAAGEGGAQGDNLTIRGFSARNDLFIDGMRDFGSYYRDPFNIEEVEVLQGPSSVTFGRGSTGGVVNQETKTPMSDRFLSGAFDFGTDLTRRAAVDLNTPVPLLGRNTAFRLNLMGNQGNIAGRDIAENRRFGVAPSLEFGVGTATRLTFSYFHQSADDKPDYGIPWLFNGPAPVNRRNYYGFRNGNFLRTDDDIGTIRLEHDFNSHFTIRNQIRYANYVRDALVSEAQIASNVTLATPLSAITINRNEIAVNSVETFFGDQLDLTANFQTGSIRHTLVTGVEAARETSDPTRPRYTGVPTTTLLAPDPDQAFAGTASISSIVHTTSRSAGAYAIDTIRLGRKWELTGGFRWDRFNTHYTQAVAPASAFNRLDELPTWRAGVVYKPIPAASIYAAAGTSFNPSAESLSLSAANANLPPEKNRTIEAGAKWDARNHRLALRGALFRTGKTNAREPDPANSLLNVLAGSQRVNGVQLEITGHVTSRWDVLTSYAHLDAEVVSSKYYPAAVGAQLANVPRDTFNIWNSVRLPGGWQAGAGGNFVASRTASSTAPFDPATGLVKKVPGYWVFNAMAEHRLSEHASLQANVYNIANRYYYDQLYPAHIVPGPGRSALMGLKFRF
jgi:catecholate siderophore receptor